MNQQECILRKTSEFSWASLAHYWKPLEDSRRRRGIKGACEERPFLLYPAAVIWHHLLLQGAEAYRERTPASRHNPGRCMSAICPACCRDQCGRERMTPVLELRQRDTVMSGCTLADSSADTRPGQTLATEVKGFWLAPLQHRGDHFDVKHHTV